MVLIPNLWRSGLKSLRRRIRLVLIQPEPGSLGVTEAVRIALLTTYTTFCIQRFHFLFFAWEKIIRTQRFTIYPNRLGRLNLIRRVNHKLRVVCGIVHCHQAAVELFALNYLLYHTPSYGRHLSSWPTDVKDLAATIGFPDPLLTESFSCSQSSRHWQETCLVILTKALYPIFCDVRPKMPIVTAVTKLLGIRVWVTGACRVGSNEFW